MFGGDFYVTMTIMTITMTVDHFMIKPTTMMKMKIVFYTILDDDADVVVSVQ